MINISSFFLLPGGGGWLLPQNHRTVESASSHSRMSNSGGYMPRYRTALLCPPCEHFNSDCPAMAEPQL
eukprot:760162-Hanusia_phi.AAC.5